jgi:hypothetical protein
VGVAAVKVEIEGESVHRWLNQETEGELVRATTTARSLFRYARQLSDIGTRNWPSHLYGSDTRGGAILTVFLYT